MKSTGMLRTAKFILCIACLCSFSLSTLAYDVTEGNVTASLGPFFARSDFTDAKSGASAPFKRGWGLLASADVNRSGAVDFGLFYLNKLYLRQDNALYLAERTELIHIAMGYRQWLTSFLSVSLSLFSAYSIGDVFTEYTDFPGSQKVNTSAYDTTEYGLDGSLMIELWSNKELGLVAEGRYSKSLTPKENEKADHYGAFIALRFLVQQSYRPAQGGSKTD